MASGYFQELATDIPIVEDDIFGEGAPWDLRDSKSSNYYVPSVLKRVEEHCPAHSSSNQFYFRFLKKMIKDALSVLVSADEDDRSCENTEDAFAADKVQMEKSFAASSKKMAAADHRIQ